MRCLAVCQNELVARTLAESLLPTFELDILVEQEALARRLREAGLEVEVGNPRKTETYLTADVTPQTCIVIEDNGRRSLKRTLDAARDAGGALIYVLGTGTGHAERADALRSQAPEATYLSLSALCGTPLVTEFGRALTRARVQQYQRYLSDADRILILLHNDPDPDALASGLAIRTLLRRTKTTAIIAALQGVTRPENLRMAHMLDIQVEPMTPDMFSDFHHIVMVDVQPHYFGGLLTRADLVIDHHPEQPGYNAVYKDIRATYGSTSTILTEHLRAVDAPISERTATAMLYAIKSDTLFFNRQANQVDLEAFSYLYPLADATLIRKMEGAEITLERLEHVTAIMRHHLLGDHIFSGYLGDAPREDLIPYAADFFLHLENVKWSIITGLVHDQVVISVRSLGYSRSAGDFVRKHFDALGSAGGHRSMAKAVVPVDAFREHYGKLKGSDVAATLHTLLRAFLAESTTTPERRRETVRS